MDAELVKVIIVVIIMIGAGIAQLRNKIKEQGQGQGPGRPRPDRPRTKPLDDEIGEFLRRAGQQRRGSPPAPQPSPTQAPRPNPPFRRPETVVQAEVVRQPSGGEVSEHVRTQLDTSEFSRREEHLADDVTQADEKRDERLRGVFDHRLGQFASSSPDASSAASGESVSMGADALIALLTTPQTVRQAIIINEILQRPEQRWT